MTKNDFRNKVVSDGIMTQLAVDSLNTPALLHSLATIFFLTRARGPFVDKVRNHLDLLVNTGVHGLED